MGVISWAGTRLGSRSAVAYSVPGSPMSILLNIILLFERFLNPDRISMPDVDIDFDDDGRQLVLDYVTEKVRSEKR